MPPDGPDGKKYTIQLNRYYKVGDRYDISSVGSQIATSESVFVAQMPLFNRKELSVALIGTVEVAAVDEKGLPTKLLCTIVKFVDTTVSDPFAAHILAPESNVIVDATAERAAGQMGKTIYSLQDGDLSPAQTEALSLVLSAHPRGDPTDDDGLGTKEPQLIGGVWPIDTAAVVDVMSRSGMIAKLEDVAGEATLSGVTNIAGRDILRITAKCSAKHLDMKNPNLHVENATMESTHELQLPVDLTWLRIIQSNGFVLDIHLTTAGPDGVPIRIHTTMTRHSTCEKTPIAK